MSNHTPGPWRLMNSHKAGFLNVYTTHDCASSPDSTATDFICEIGPGARVDGELNQNAKLIAAAPELLEACRSMLAWMEFTIPNLDRYKVPDRMNYGGPLHKARQALLKAGIISQDEVDALTISH